MEQLKAALEEQKKIKERLTEILKVEVSSTEPQNIDYENSGEVTDMIKDMAEAEKNCWEAQYYKMMCEAMNKELESGGDESFRSNGFGSSMMGFQPEMRIPPEMRHMMERERFGYGNGGGQGGSSGGRDGSSSSGSGGSYGGRSGRSGYSMGDNWDPQYGESYNRYKEALRHYHESGQKEDMDEMDTHANEHVRNAIRSFREIYSSASPTTKKKLKEDLTKLVGEM